MSGKLIKWETKTSGNILRMDFINEIKDVLPTVAEEMEKLRSLTVNRSLDEKEQKKQAGFIQQRKRMRLNDLFKTLQNMGFSYRFGVTNCEDINNSEEMFKHLEDNSSKLWNKSEKYFFRCFARFRHLLSLLDRAPPPDIGTNLNERFQGFVQHMLSLSRSWRKILIDFIKTLTELESIVGQFDEKLHHDLSRSGSKYSALVKSSLQTFETLSMILENRRAEFEHLEEFKQAADVSKSTTAFISDHLYNLGSSPFAPHNNKETLKRISCDASKILSLIRLLSERNPGHILSEEWSSIIAQLRSVNLDIDNWTMQRPLTSSTPNQEEAKVILKCFSTNDLFSIDPIFSRSATR